MILPESDLARNGFYDRSAMLRERFGRVDAELREEMRNGAPVTIGGWAADCPCCSPEIEPTPRFFIDNEYRILPCPHGHASAEIMAAADSFRACQEPPRQPGEDDDQPAAAPGLTDEGVADFFATAADKIPWVMEPYIPKGGLVIVQGAPKSGKTWFAAWLAGECAKAGYRVAVVEEEGAREVLRDRLKPFVPDAKAVNGTLRVLYRKRIRLDVPSVLKQLVDLYRGFDVIVLDPFIRLHGKKEQSSDEMALVLEAVQTLMAETGAAVVLIHHTKKTGWDRGADGAMDNGRGSGVTAGEADNVIEIKSVPPRQRMAGQVRFTVENPGSRVGPEFEKKTAVIDLMGASEPFTWMADELPAKAAGDAVEEALELILACRKLPQTEHDAISGSSIAKLIKYNKAATLEAVPRCVNHGVLEQAEGRWGPVYWRKEKP